MALDTPGVKCRARSTNYGDPIDCDWPFCGCDDHAEKVVQSLHECGWEDASDLRRLLSEAHDVLHKVTGIISDRDSGHAEITDLMRRIRKATQD